MDVSGCVHGLRRGVLRRRRHGAAARMAGRQRRRSAPSVRDERAARARRSRARARSSASGSTYAITRAESGTPIPTEPVLFFKSTTRALRLRTTTLVDPARRHEGRLGSRARGRDRTRRARTCPRRARSSTSPATRCTTTTPSAPSSSSAAASGSRARAADTFAPLGPLLAHDRPRVARLRGRSACGSPSTARRARRARHGEHGLRRARQLVSYVSQFMTLLPGDVISTGTPAGVGMGMKPDPVYLRPGDVVELGIDGLGQSRQEVKPPR